MEAKGETASSVENQLAKVSTYWRFTWTIEKFSSFKNTKHYSDVLSADGYKWQVLIFPKGNDVEFLSVYLAVADLENLADGWSRHAEFSLSVVNQFSSQKNRTQETRHRFKAGERDWGFTKFMSLTELNDPSNGFLVKDKLIVQAEILGVKDEGAKTDTTICLNQAVEGEPSLSPELRKLKIQVFEDMPQNPHYAPLDKYSDKVREGMIIGLDIAFVNLSQEIRKLEDPEAFLSKLECFMKQLMELEEMGYNVEKLREHLGSLEKIAERDRAAKEAVNKLEAQVKEYENKITEYKSEIDKMKKNSVDALNEFESTAKSMRK